MRKLIFMVALVVFAVSAAGCQIASRRPPAQAGGPVKVKLKPANAKISMRTRWESPDVIRVRAEAKEFGSWREPFRRRSTQTFVELRHPGFSSLFLDLEDYSRVARGALVRFPAERNQLETSLRRAARVYNLPAAYPRWLPADLRRTSAGVHIAPRFAEPKTMLVIDWGVGKRHLMMRFMPPEALKRIPNRPRAPTYRLQVTRRIEARVFGADHADLYLDGKELPWDMAAQGLLPAEFKRIVKSVKLL